MAEIIYYVNMKTENGWNVQNEFWFDYPIGEIPENDGEILYEVTNIRLEVYCGYSVANKNQESYFKITDDEGKTVTIEGKINSGNAQPNRITAKLEGVPDVELNWNNLQTISVGLQEGESNNLFLRDDNAKLIIEYSEIFFETSPGSPQIKQNNEGTFKIEWTPASLSDSSKNSEIEYNVLSILNGEWVFLNNTKEFTGIGTIPVYDEEVEYKTFAFYKTLLISSEKISIKFNSHSTIKYYTTAKGWQECIVYYQTGDLSKGDNGWIECQPYLYTGEPTATIDGWQLCSHK